jgi:hypothetical protein
MIRPKEFRRISQLFEEGLAWPWAVDVDLDPAAALFHFALPRFSMPEKEKPLRRSFATAFQKKLLFVTD